MRGRWSNQRDDDLNMGRQIMNVENGLSRLRELSKSLNEVSDQLNTDLADFEAKLNKLRFGIEIILPENLKPQSQTHLGYGRVGSRWCLTIVRATGLPQPLLTSASRNDKLAAIDLLPHLLAAIELQAQVLLSKLNKLKGV